MKKIWTDKKEYEKEYKAIEKTLPDFLEELKDFASDFLETNFKIEDTIPIIFNGRLTRCGGRFSFNKIEAKNIEISKKNTIHSIMMNKKVKFSIPLNMSLFIMLYIHWKNHFMMVMKNLNEL